MSEKDFTIGAWTQSAATATPEIKATIQVVDTSIVASETFDKLAGLFTAILELSDNKYSTIHSLASTGQYLANDWSNFYDCQQEEWSSKLDAIRAAAMEAAKNPA